MSKIDWKRAKFHLPTEGVPVLVCYGGGHMFVSEGRIFDSESIQVMKEQNPTREVPAGYFKDYGQKIYFNEDDVYWSLLPEPPKENKTLKPIGAKEEPVKPISLEEENKLNAIENKYGEMSKEEMADHFKEPVPMERGTDEIYAIAARVKNACVMAVGNNLTQSGHMLCNTYTHTIKAFYDFAKTIKDDKDRERLNSFIKSQEGMAANFVSAAMANVAAVIEENRKKGVR